jgi:rare lipoprotein A
MTASSNTLPCNTMVKVTANDKTITVKVTDKGSLGPGVILSLTKAAAAELEIVAQGVAPCTVVEV